MIKKKYSITKEQRRFAVLTLLATYAIMALMSYVFYILPDIYTVTQDISSVISFFGVLLVMVALLGVYCFCADIKVMKNKKKFLFMCAIMLMNYGVCFIFWKFVSPYSVPYAFGALLCGIAISKKSGFLTTSLVSLVMFFGQTLFGSGGIIPTDYLPLFVGFTTAIVASYALSDQSTRIKYIFAMLGLSMLAIVVNFLIILAADLDAIADNWMHILTQSTLSGVAAVGLFMICVPVLDSVFNFVTNFRLAELVATDAPLIKKMFKETPGSFNHSLSVANYTEACASAIGENTLFARAAALYHDIGKLKNPTYFKENQTDGFNPHNEITAELSTSYIKKHVTAGVQLARENRLPEAIISFIVEHHGTMPIQFFYSKAQSYTEEELEVNEFRHDGPKPSSKISAILMISDACEAALRAVSAGNVGEASKIVQDIIASRLADGQFDECNITMQELNIIKDTIITVYVGISHERILYPDQQRGVQS